MIDIKIKAKQSTLVLETGDCIIFNEKTKKATLSPRRNTQDKVKQDILRGNISGEISLANFKALFKVCKMVFKPSSKPFIKFYYPEPKK